MMKYFGLVENDFTPGQGLSVTLVLQGCPFKCQDCLFKSFQEGTEIPNDIKSKIVKALCSNSLHHNFNIIGGQPFCKENLHFILNLVNSIRMAFPHIQIAIWTNYSFEELIDKKDEDISEILQKINILIDSKHNKKICHSILTSHAIDEQSAIFLNEIE